MIVNPLLATERQVKNYYNNQIFTSSYCCEDNLFLKQSNVFSSEPIYTENNPTLSGGGEQVSELKGNQKFLSKEHSENESKEIE